MSAQLKNLYQSIYSLFTPREFLKPVRSIVIKINGKSIFEQIRLALNKYYNGYGTLTFSNLSDEKLIGYGLKQTIITLGHLRQPKIIEESIQKSLKNTPYPSVHR